MNKLSSRSHAVLQIRLRWRRRAVDGAAAFERKHCRQDADGRTLTAVRTAVLSVVDLAGSERLKRSLSTGPRLKEARSINSSLLALGKCMQALARAEGGLGFVPYRESKLTYLLQNSLGGNCKTGLVVCISAERRDASETLSSLDFAARALSVGTHATINTALVELEATELSHDMCDIPADAIAAADLAELDEARPATLRLTDMDERALCECLSRVRLADVGNVRRSCRALNALPLEGWLTGAFGVSFGGCGLARLSSHFCGSRVLWPVKMLPLLLRAVDIDGRDAQGRTLLWKAAGNGRKVVVDVLIAEGASVDIANNRGVTPLSWLSCTSVLGRGLMVETLIQARADVNKEDSDKHTPLWWASGYNRIETVRALIASGADVDAANHDGITPLSIAAARGHAAVVHELIGEGADKWADMMVCDHHGRTAVWWAAENGYTAIVQP